MISLSHLFIDLQDVRFNRTTVDQSYSTLHSTCQMDLLISGLLVRLRPSTKWQATRLLQLITRLLFSQYPSFPHAHSPSIHAVNVSVIFSYSRLPGKPLSYIHGQIIDKSQ